MQNNDRNHIIYKKIIQLLSETFYLNLRILKYSSKLIKMDGILYRFGRRNKKTSRKE